MKRTTWLSVALSIVVGTCGHATVLAADGAANKAEIENSINSYVAAFNARDSESLAAHWSPEAVYTNPATGDQVVGREAIKKEFDALLLENKEDRLVVDVESIQFVSPNVAVEHGVATVIGPEEDLEITSYTAVHVKRNGEWLLDRVSEAEETEPPSHYEQLKDLEWLIGTWLDASENDLIETTCQWARNDNFIIRSFKVSVQDRIDMSGIQVIGWDPAAGSIRSWAFDSNGGFAEGTWTKKNDRWFVESNALLPDGQKGSSDACDTPTHRLA